MSSDGASPANADRRRRIVEAVGDDALAAGLPQLRPVLVVQLQRLFDEVVLPIVRPSWPDVDDAAFLPKWRGGSELYAALGTSLLITSAKRSRTVAVACAIVDRADVDEAGVVAAARIALPFVLGVLERERCERVALCAAWIIVLDEVLDETLRDLPAGRRRRAMAAIVGGRPWTSLPAERAAAALARAIRRRCRSDDDHRALDVVVAAVDRWVEGELSSLAGDDPDGDRWRRAGATASMDLLLWALGDAGADDERRLLYAVAELGQRVDDLLDVDVDRAQGRSTPATTGWWSIDGIGPLFDETTSIFEQLAARVATPGGPLRRLLVRSFRAELQRLGQVLVALP